MRERRVRGAMRLRRMSEYLWMSCLLGELFPALILRHADESGIAVCFGLLVWIRVLQDRASDCWPRI